MYLPAARNVLYFLWKESDRQAKDVFACGENCALFLVERNTYSDVEIQVLNCLWSETCTFPWSEIIKKMLIVLECLRRTDGL